MVSGWWRTRAVSRPGSWPTDPALGVRKVRVVSVTAAVSEAAPGTVLGQAPRAGTPQQRERRTAVILRVVG